MNDNLGPRGLGGPRRADAVLRAARTFWFIVTVVGQWMFVYFIVAYYYQRTFRGAFAQWNEKPLIEGDAFGILMFAAHVLMAAAMTGTGTLQLVPQLRARWPGFHRNGGRLFISTAVLLAAGGLYLVWIRGTYLSLAPAVAITFDGLLIFLCAGMTIGRARMGDIASHRRWALRLFMAANGVWMLRVGFMFWAILTGGAGMTKNMDGAFDVFWAFGCYGLPLAILELYLRVDAQGSPQAKILGAIILFVVTVAIAIGAVGAYAFMWAPYV